MNQRKIRVDIIVTDKIVIRLEIEGNYNKGLLCIFLDTKFPDFIIE
jgi:hypothetical protein